jgi:hypothetical protein
MKSSLMASSLVCSTLGGTWGGGREVGTVACRVAFGVNNLSSSARRKNDRFIRLHMMSYLWAQHGEEVEEGPQILIRM